MPSIPVNTALGFIGFLLVLVGGFLLLAGLGIVGVEKISVKPGKPTWILGGVFAILGILLISFSEPLKQTPNTTIPTNTPESTSTVGATETLANTVNTPISEKTSTPLYEVAKGWTLEAYEPFDRNDAGWFVGIDEWYTREIKNGEYVWSIAPLSENVWFWQISPFDSYSDFFVSVSTRRSGDPNNMTSYGLIFRRQGAKFYLFRINDYNSFAVQFIDNGEWTDVIGWTKTNAVQVGSFNDLAVVAIGSELTFYINQTQVGSVTDTLSKQGNIGFTISTEKVSERVDFEFDDFEVRLKP